MTNRKISKQILYLKFQINFFITRILKRTVINVHFMLPVQTEKGKIKFWNY